MHPRSGYVISSNHSYSFPSPFNSKKQQLQHNLFVARNQPLCLAKAKQKTSTMADSDTRESNMKAALKAIEEGRMTYSQAHETYGIGVGTLNGRKKGAKPRREAHRTEKKLSQALEDSIVHWILFERRNNRPPTKGLVRQYAQHICDVSSIPTKIDHNWAS